jgi:hypothetical protein
MDTSVIPAGTFSVAVTAFGPTVVAAPAAFDTVNV